jgi:hypothetical protein
MEIQTARAVLSPCASATRLAVAKGRREVEHGVEYEGTGQTSVLATTSS